jgi:hypothetical protein
MSYQSKDDGAGGQNTRRADAGYGAAIMADADLP